MASTGPDSQARALLLSLSVALSPFGDRLVLIGGLAVNLLRRPRFTDDIDFIAASGEATIRGIIDRLGQDGYRVVQSFGEGLPSGPDFIRVSRPGSLAIEFMTAKTDFQQAVIDRARTVQGLPGIRVATAEDLFVLKLIANRSQDHLDLLELGKVPDLDWAYIEHWAPIWDVGDRLASLRELLARPE